MLAGKRIIFLLPSLELGGAERQAVLLASYLRRECSADIEVWGLEGPGPVRDLCREEGLACVLTPFRPNGNPLADLFRTVSFARRLRRARPDILLPYTLIPNLLAGLVWKWTAARVCIWNQRDEGFNLHRQVSYHRRAVANVTACIVNSERGRELLITDFGLPPERVDLVMNGVTLGSPAHGRDWWRTQLDASDRDFVACMVANLHKYKDHRTVIRGWRRVVDSLAGECGRPLLVLAGRFDGTETDILDEIAELGLRDHVRLPGRVDDIPGLLAAVDMGLFSSLSEGCPNGVLESMLASLPVVAGDIAGVRDIFGSLGEGLLFIPGDPESMAERVVAIACATTGERRAVGTLLAERVCQLHSPQLMCTRTESILRHYLSCAVND